MHCGLRRTRWWLPGRFVVQEPPIAIGVLIGTLGLLVAAWTGPKPLQIGAMAATLTVFSVPTAIMVSTGDFVPFTAGSMVPAFLLASGTLLHREAS